MPPRLSPRPPGLKDKDLAGVPFRLVLALQADGWWWRQTIVWDKPNPMPESVEDRPTTSHEYVFLLTKAARYYYDAEAVKQPASSGERFHGGYSPPSPDGSRTTSRNGRKSLPGRDGMVRSHDQWHEAHSEPVDDRNLRTVWTIPTQPYRGAHFAVFPPRLPELCILAGSSERGVCPECGRPWKRLLERTAMEIRPGPGRAGFMAASRTATSRTAITGTMLAPTVVDVAWGPTCAHQLDPVPALVLDPFGGSGTVGLVAQRLRRRATLIDLNPAYLEQQLERAAREWGRGGKRLVDRPAEPPSDSLWAHMAAEEAVS